MLAAVSSAGAVIVCAAAALGAFLLWRARKPRAAGDLTLSRVADGVWIYRGFFSNSCVFVFEKCCLLVDTQVSPHGARRLRREIEAKIGLPVRYVVNTHHHGDHMGGNAVFVDSEIIASQDTAKLATERDEDRTRYAQTFGLEFQEWHPTTAPTRLFSDHLKLEIDGEPVEIKRLGAAETTDACVVFLPRRGAIASGDSVSTWDYPFLGTPFLDEGLHDDGQWIGVLNQIAALSPKVLLPGHGPALVGAQAISSRLDLLARLMRELLEAVRPRVRAGEDVATIVREVDRELALYRRHPGLREHTLCQRFAIYRCINSLRPDRRGKGWWQDLRPSAIRRAPESEVAGPLAAVGSREALVLAVDERLAKKDRPAALALVEGWLKAHEKDAAGWGLLSDILFDGARGVYPTVDGTEYLAEAGSKAKRALALDPRCAVALLNLGAFEVFGAMVLAQKMDAPIGRLTAALASGALTANQARKALFFIGKAHQMEGRDGEADRFFRQALPAWLRPFFWLVRETLRTTP